MKNKVATGGYDLGRSSRVYRFGSLVFKVAILGCVMAALRIVA